MSHPHDAEPSKFPDANPRDSFATPKARPIPWEFLIPEDAELAWLGRLREQLLFANPKDMTAELRRGKMLDEVEHRAQEHVRRYHPERARALGMEVR
jgi:hypothetical protein